MKRGLVLEQATLIFERECSEHATGYEYVLVSIICQGSECNEKVLVLEHNRKK